jgi:AAA15 family ATPase/GTPase
MKISKIHLKNFKRFTELTIDQIPLDTKLVLLIGANGSGKSSVFDAFNFLIIGYTKHYVYDSESFKNYYFKSVDDFFEVSVLSDKGEIIKNNIINVAPLSRNLLGRSSIRIIPKITHELKIDRNAAVEDSDSPINYTENDTRFANDVFLYIQDVVSELSKPAFEGRSADTLQIFQEFIRPLNKSLLNVFGGNENVTIQIAEFRSFTPEKPANLIFKKGDSKISYDLLSHGEKQVIILLLNFIVRKKYYEDAIIFIDEMDCHLNTALQFNLLKEITEVWIPDSSQLWTASHALGFIDYAHKTSNAQIIDFDLRNYDVPQTLYPEPKENIEVYDIAIGKDVLPSLFKQMDMFFVENTDKEYYANLNIPKTIFISENNRNSVFHKVRTTQFKGIVDRDFLSDDDIEVIHKNYPNLFILAYYSIENYLYHPDNLAEYYQEKGSQFDRNQYIDDLRSAKNEVIDRIAISLSSTRNEYPYFKEPGFNQKPELQKRFKSESENFEQSMTISKYLKSDELEEFYKVLPMKTYCKQLSQRQNVPKSELTKTKWFRNQIEKIIKP